MHQDGPQVMTKTRRLALIGGVLLGLVFVLFVVSNVLPSWGVGEIDGLSITAGLWRACKTHSTEPVYKECFASVLTCSGVHKLDLGQCLKLMTTRAFITAVCIFSAFGTMVLLTIGITGRNNPTLIILGKVLVTGSLIFGVIGFAVGIAWTVHDFGALGAAAIFLAVVATTMNTAGAVVVLAIPKQEV